MTDSTTSLVLTNQVPDSVLATVSDKKLLTKLRKATGCRKIRVFDIGRTGDDSETYLVVSTKGRTWVARGLDEFKPIEVV